MSTRHEDLTGRVFGKLTVLRRAGRRKGFALWLCRCECGAETEGRSDQLKSGRKVKCGWVNHPGVGKEELRRRSRLRPGVMTRAGWERMMRRCFDEAHSHWRYYGGRGITVCEWWREYGNFLADMGHRPGREYSIERLDVDRDYEPANCKWGTDREQRRNKRNTIYVEWRDERRKLVEVCEEEGRPYQLTAGRLKRGWSLERALTEPVRVRRRG